MSDAVGIADDEIIEPMLECGGSGFVDTTTLPADRCGGRALGLCPSWSRFEGCIIDADAQLIFTPAASGFLLEDAAQVAPESAFEQIAGKGVGNGDADAVLIDTEPGLV